MKKEKRASIYLDTIDMVKNGYTIGDKTITIDNNIISSNFYKKRISIDFDNLEKYDTKIEVLDSDSLAAAYKLVEQGYHPAVLNMASASNPGGGVFSGSGAQEENLFRRTNLFTQMYRYCDRMAKKMGMEYDDRNQYPLNMNNGAVYCKNVTVFRDTENNYYAPLEEPFLVDVVSVAGYRDPYVDENGHIEEAIKNITRNKIKTILNVALINGNDSLVLSALGCGAFHNPPKEIAKLFKEILETDEYKDKFKYIVFAILDGKQEGNYKAFYDVFNE